MEYLKYNTEKMKKTKTTYENCAKQMDEIRKKMKTMVDEVKEGWKSEAGEAFFDKYDNEWLKGFNQYKEVLEHMAGNLDIAKNKYSEITKDINKLNI